jgi:3-hydroxyisobutyrate dehydrogenase-like beta-hydroxyacid dehydrogenase
LLAEAVRLAERLGVPDSALLAALPHGSADSRVLNLAAAQGSLSAFALLVGDFVRMDVAAVRDVAKELGGGLGVLDDVINAIHASDPL